MRLLFSLVAIFHLHFRVIFMLVVMHLHIPHLVIWAGERHLFDNLVSPRFLNVQTQSPLAKHFQLNVSFVLARLVQRYGMGRSYITPAILGISAPMVNSAPSTG